MKLPYDDFLFLFLFGCTAHCAKVLICTVKSVKKQRRNILEPVKKKLE